MEKEQLEHLRHSCAHLLAAAVQELYPEAKRTIGPPIENGFYYDFWIPKYLKMILPKLKKKCEKS